MSERQYAIQCYSLYLIAAVIHIWILDLAFNRFEITWLVTSFFKQFTMSWIILITAGIFEVAFAACLGKAKRNYWKYFYCWYAVSSWRFQSAWFY